ncbi:MAG: alpha-E domain-containing protein [Prevotellaceae bacterium]|nr:alpha-E domain-containing protein [Prevotellaceae bacterium]
MVKSDIISATKANNLFWLGRYEDRVYMTLHVMNKCYDRMIDGHPEEYMDLWRMLDMSGIYETNEAFTLGMLYDENNPCSLMSAQKYAMDNAILLREDILSETLSYLEMSIALMKKCKAAGVTNITELQPVNDWSLAFWGSAEQRIQNHRALMIMMLGRNVENLDMLIRFCYPFRRVALAYESLKRYMREMDEMIDGNIEKQLDELIVVEKFNLNDMEYKYRLIKYVNQLIRV